MKFYELAVKAVKKEFYTASIASASSCPAQLFRVIQSLTFLTERTQDVRNLAISCEASYLQIKICHFTRTSHQILIQYMN